MQAVGTPLLARLFGGPIASEGNPMICLDAILRIYRLAEKRVVPVAVVEPLVGKLRGWNFLRNIGRAWEQLLRQDQEIKSQCKGRIRLHPRSLSFMQQSTASRMIRAKLSAPRCAEELSFKNTNNKPHSFNQPKDTRTDDEH
jgi:hypothetical protein